MVFENKTPFPAIGWLSLNNQAKEFTSVVVRVKYLFDTMNKEGVWSLKLDTKQDELFGEDIFYDEPLTSSVRFESDYIAYKPHADLIVNAHSYSEEERSWNCAVKMLRQNKVTEKKELLVKQELKVYGQRYWVDKLLFWEASRAEPCSKVELRYENAFGGFKLNPKYKEGNGEEKYLSFYEKNPVGKGFYLKKHSKKDEMELAQIEGIDEPVYEPFTTFEPQGLGFIHRSRKNRLLLAGTFDDVWTQTKSPIMPDDFKEEYNNGAHPNLQYREGYFKGNDVVELYRLLKGKEKQSFKLPNFYFKGRYHVQDKALPFYLDIDTVIVDILEENMDNNAVYVSYRKRVRHSPKVEKVSLSMIVPKDFVAKKEEEQ